MPNRRSLVRLFAWLALLAPVAAHADIRFYTINDRGQQSLLPLVWKPDSPGCHALPISWKVHKVAVVRFEYCEVFSSRDCADGTQVKAYWKKKPNRSATFLTPGTEWYFDPKGEVEVGSWRCK